MTEMEWLDIFRDNLQSIIDNANMSRKELSEVSGISKSTISRYLTKDRYRLQMPSVIHIINLSYALDCDVNDLIDFGDSVEL